jgi:eukaryotic-like serine/threonine-protein kinase
VTRVGDEGAGAATVGNFVGLPIDEVRTQVGDAGWVAGEREVRDDTIEIGLVVAQRPAEGVELEAGRTVTVDVVTGRLLVLMPALIGVEASAATARLQARGFEVTQTDSRFDEDVPAGTVIEARIDGQIEPGLTLHERGTAVSLLVSNGPTPRSVPDLVGMSVEDAEAAVEAVQLGLSVTSEDFSEDVAAGGVISQGVAPGEAVERGSAVEVVVSKGPDRRTVPDLDGATLDQAVAALEDVGLRSGGVQGSGSVVRFTEPGAGAKLPPGSEVVLFAPG